MCGASLEPFRALPISAVCEELVDAINASHPVQSKIPLTVRLRHSANVVDALAQMQWDRRENALMEFVNSEAALWDPGAQSQTSTMKGCLYG